MSLKRQRLVYTVVFLALLLTEILIALFVHDDIVRPYVGDVLVTVLICAFARIFFPFKVRLLPLWVCVFAFAVEIGQYFDIVSLVGLGNISFFRVLIGSTFSLPDLVCYTVGCVIFCIGDMIFKKHICKPDKT